MNIGIGKGIGPLYVSQNLYSSKGKSAPPSGEESVIVWLALLPFTLVGNVYLIFFADVALYENFSGLLEVLFAGFFWHVLVAPFAGVFIALMHPFISLGAAVTAFLIFIFWPRKAPNAKP